MDTHPAEQIDCAVIGGGVVGLAVARALALSGREVILFEAESALGTGTSSRNSEVIHAGIYYPSGSLKARLCVPGRDALYRYCETRGVAHRRLGKLIAATTAEEVGTLARYAAQARANGVTDLRTLTADEARALEPQLRCVAGLLSPSSGIIDSHALMLAYQAELEAHGGTVLTRSRITGGSLAGQAVVLHVADAADAADVANAADAAGASGASAGTRLSVRARTVVNCAGLGAQQLSRQIDGVPPQSIPPRYLARGQYFSLAGRAPFHRLVYPIAEAGGLGIHVTLDLSGRVRFGPDVQWIGEVDYSFDESRRDAFIRAIRRYYPTLDPALLQPAYTGIRPKISGPGQPDADFCIRGPKDHDGCAYVALYGIESPGLTASLALADYVLALLQGVPDSA
jgi:L-2-hydroxyglutarate oxidase LhgO